MAGYYYRGTITGYLDRSVPSIREQIADALHTVEEGTSDALGRLRTSVGAKLRGAEQSLRTASQTAAPQAR